VKNCKKNGGIGGKIHNPFHQRTTKNSPCKPPKATTTLRNLQKRPINSALEKMRYRRVQDSRKNGSYLQRGEKSHRKCYEVKDE